MITYEIFFRWLHFLFSAFAVWVRANGYRKYVSRLLNFTTNVSIKLNKIDGRVSVEKSQKKKKMFSFSLKNDQNKSVKCENKWWKGLSQNELETRQRKTAKKISKLIDDLMVLFVFISVIWSSFFLLQMMLDMLDQFENVVNVFIILNAKRKNVACSAKYLNIWFLWKLTIFRGKRKMPFFTNTSNVFHVFVCVRASVANKTKRKTTKKKKTWKTSNTNYKRFFFSRKNTLLWAFIYPDFYWKTSTKRYYWAIYRRIFLLHRSSTLSLLRMKRICCFLRRKKNVRETKWIVFAYFFSLVMFADWYINSLFFFRFCFPARHTSCV